MSKVFWTDTRTNMKKSNFAKLRDLIYQSHIEKIITEDDITSVKLHFGEMGNVSFIRPIYVREIIKILKKLGSKPFLTDANTIYKGSRTDAVNHYETALKNGFNYTTVDAPVIIADGLRGKAYVEKNFDNFKYKNNIEIPEAVYYSDSMVVLSHFKGHEVTGFGGALKNVGMGLATKSGKLFMHSNCVPLIKKKKCVKCGLCIKWCPADAIDYSKEKATIIEDRCVGCGQCILTCPHNAISLDWNASAKDLQKKMMEQCYAMIHNKKNKVLFINFCMDIIPECDCYGHSDAKILPDIGIFASTDPVALDKACVDAVNRTEAIKGNNALSDKTPDKDILKWLYPDIDYNIQFKYAEKLGLGTTNYELIKVDEVG